MIVAVVPAAGHSTRMGRPKLSLPLGDRTILEHVVTALRTGGADRVVVVIGPHVPELIPLAQTAGADACLLAELTPDMRSTVQHGLVWIEEHIAPLPDAWLLAPADHPTLDSSVLRELCACFRSDTSHSIFVPAHGSKRGHPALIHWKHVEAIRGLSADRGINAYFRERVEELREVPTASENVLCDLDTPEDYQHLVASWQPGG